MEVIIMVGMSFIERLFWSFMSLWPLWVFILVFVIAGICEYIKTGSVFGDDDEEEDEYEEDDYYDDDYYL